MREKPRDPMRRRVLRLASAQRDVEEELKFHFIEAVEELVEGGLTREQAEAEAGRRFGDRAFYRSQLERMDHEAEVLRRGRSAFDVLLQTLRFSLRSIRRTPGLSAGIVLALALGIGANAVMFSTLDRLLLRPPDHIRDATSLHRLYVDRYMAPFGERRLMDFTYDDFADVSRADVFAGMAASWAFTAPLGDGSRAFSVSGQAVSGSYWPLLGVQPHIGHFFGQAEDGRYAGPVVVLSHGLWRREYGSDPSVLGRAVTIGTRRHTIIGVAPEGFTGVDLSRTDVWVSFQSWFDNVIRASGGPVTVSWPFVRVVARLSPGVPPEYALQQARDVYLASQPEFSERDSADVVVTAPLSAARFPGSTSLTRAASVTRWLGAVSLLVLLIACANAANLLLARAIRQRKETAIRLALGVSRARLFGQTLSDGLVLGVLASALAIALTYWGGTAMQRTFLPQVAWNGALTSRVLLVLLTVSVGAGLLPALLPALQARRDAVAHVLRGTAGGTQGSATRLRAWLAVAQAAFSVVLLVGAGLFVRSFQRAQAVDLGFDADNVIELRPRMTGQLGPDDGLLVERVRERIARVPGVLAAAAAGDPPFGRAGSVPLRATGHDSIPVRAGSGPYIRRGTPQLLRALGIPILQGRDFEPADARGERVAIVSQSMARELWPNENALGKCLHAISRAREDPCSRIVGVAADAKASSVNETTTLTYYVVHEEQIGVLQRLLVRTDGATPGLTASLRRELLNADSRIRDVSVATLRQDYVDPQVRPWKLGATLFSIFGLLALIIALIGLYSVLAFDVEQRRREIGLRTALGASRNGVLRMFLARAVKLSAFGTLIGILVALALAPRIEGLLFRIPARDPVTFAAISLVLLIFALCAAGLPAWRAAGIDPNVTLREE